MGPQALGYDIIWFQHNFYIIANLREVENREHAINKDYSSTEDHSNQNLPCTQKPILCIHLFFLSTFSPDYYVLLKFPFPLLIRYLGGFIF